MIKDLDAPFHENNNELTESLRYFAGTNITHWFKTTNNKDTNVEVLQFVHPETNELTFKIPHGLFPGIYDQSEEFKSWWNNWNYVVGLQTCCSRKIRLVNMLTADEHSIEVCQEESMKEILARYSEINNHAKSYTWKYKEVPLDMQKTLHENGIIDEREEFISYGIHNEYFIPAIQLYFNDDLTIA